MASTSAAASRSSTGDPRGLDLKSHWPNSLACALWRRASCDASVDASTVISRQPNANKLDRRRSAAAWEAADRAASTPPPPSHLGLGLRQSVRSSRKTTSLRPRRTLELPGSMVLIDVSSVSSRHSPRRRASRISARCETLIAVHISRFEALLATPNSRRAPRTARRTRQLSVSSASTAWKPVCSRILVTFSSFSMTAANALGVVRRRFGAASWAGSAAIWRRDA
mmetsp:Transcript_10730/g.33096  ORF Transcript_10730/g.33096 Transcript_10730/m.33096 type:complete len:225 (-) Transcript_10730:116-790(-)